MKDKNKIKKFIKSFGRIPTAPPTKVIKNKKKYCRKKFKEELRKILKDEGF